MGARAAVGQAVDTVAEGRVAAAMEAVVRAVVAMAEVAKAAPRGRASLVAPQASRTGYRRGGSGCVSLGRCLRRSSSRLCWRTCWRRSSRGVTGRWESSPGTSYSTCPHTWAAGSEVVAAMLVASAADLVAEGKQGVGTDMCVGG